LLGKTSGQRSTDIGENYKKKLGVKAIFAEGPKERRVWLKDISSIRNWGKDIRLGEFNLRVIYHVYIFVLFWMCLKCVSWRLSVFFAFSGNSQKPPGGVEGPPGGSCLQSQILGSFMHRLAARLCPPGGTLFCSISADFWIPW